MNKQRVYVDRAQTIDMKLRISNNYIERIAPHELMIEAINLQNKQIYLLQQKYLKLKQQTKQAKNPSQYSESQIKNIHANQQIKMNQRKKFVEEGLKANERQQQLHFQRHKASLLEVLSNKQRMLKDMKGHQINIFFNLDENILDKLINYAANSQKVHEDKKAQFIQEINWWKKRLEIDGKNTQNSIKQIKTQ